MVVSLLHRLNKYAEHTIPRRYLRINQVAHQFKRLFQINLIHIQH